MAVGAPFDDQPTGIRKENEPQDVDPRKQLTKASNELIRHKLQGNRVSFVLVWLVATALSLITAPLVEPRYFILPWVFWRLHVSYSTPLSPSKRIGKGSIAGNDQLSHEFGDHRLVYETMWFILINAFVGYMFLYKGFEWPQEPGYVQRFMW